jgi:hypothetical protein
MICFAEDSHLVGPLLPLGASFRPVTGIWLAGRWNGFSGFLSGKVLTAPLCGFGEVFAIWLPQVIKRGHDRAAI